MKVFPRPAVQLHKSFLRRNCFRSPILRLTSYSNRVPKVKKKSSFIVFRGQVEIKSVVRYSLKSEVVSLAATAGMSSGEQHDSDWTLYLEPCISSPVIELRKGVVKSTWILLIMKKYYLFQKWILYNLYAGFLKKNNSFPRGSQTVRSKNETAVL